LTFNSYQRENATPQDYKFNGKEEQTELGLGWNDFGARMYDAAIGRFMVQDALTDYRPDWTSYRFGFNNPVRMIDPDGNYEINVTLSRDERKELRKIEDKKDRREARSNLIDSKKQEVRDMIGAAKSVIDNNAEVKEVFQAFSGIEEGSKEWDNLWTENGNGPGINYKNDKGGAGGASEGSSVFLNGENSFAENVATTLHEYVHYGDRKRSGSRYEYTANGAPGYDAATQRQALDDAFNSDQASANPIYTRQQWVNGYPYHYGANGPRGVEMGYAFEKLAFGRVYFSPEDFKEFQEKYLKNK
jgi:RHS repeat-associated protein